MFVWSGVYIDFNIFLVKNFLLMQCKVLMILCYRITVLWNHTEQNQCSSSHHLSIRLCHRKRSNLAKQYGYDLDVEWPLHDLFTLILWQHKIIKRMTFYRIYAFCLISFMHKNCAKTVNCMQEVFVDLCVCLYSYSQQNV